MKPFGLISLAVRMRRHVAAISFRGNSNAAGEYSNIDAIYDSVATPTGQPPVDNYDRADFRTRNGEQSQASGGEKTADVIFAALKRRLPVILLFTLLVSIVAVYLDWNWKRPLSPRGGRYFFHRVELPVPSFRQGDEKWSDDPLGGVPENGTLGGEGCAVAAAAMVFKFYGIDTDPQQLNWFLTAVDGYTDRGWVYWDRAAWVAPDRVRHVYEDLPSYWLIDSNLACANPVIVRVRLGNGVTHFVVIAGKEGLDYLVRDPGAGAAKGFYRLRELNSDIEGLRFYEPLRNIDSHLSAHR